jgi:hypothetical protein
MGGYLSFAIPVRFYHQLLPGGPHDAHKANAYDSEPEQEDRENSTSFRAELVGEVKSRDVKCNIGCIVPRHFTEGNGFDHAPNHSAAISTFTLSLFGWFGRFHS